MMSRILSYFNKHYKAICIIVGFLLICMILLPLGKRLYDQHVKYNWEDNEVADTLSEEPFGAYHFNLYLDSIYGKRLIHGTSIEKIYSYPCNYIIIKGNVNWTENYHASRITKYIKLASKGSNFLITGNSYYLSLDLGCVSSSTPFYSFDIDRLKKNSNTSRVNKIALDLKTDIDPDLSEYPSMYLWQNMISTTYLYIPNDAERSDDYEDCYNGIPKGTSSSLLSLRTGGDIALRRNIGKGHITLVNTPYLLTNYGLSLEDGRKGVKHILDCTINPKLPVVVIYDKEEKKVEIKSDSSKSIFYVLLEHPATALALYLLLGASLLTIIFNVRRRQRAETIVEVPQNSSITYIKHLATLYKDSSDYKELLQIERRNLLYRLRKEYRFDICTQDFTKLSEFAFHIADSKSIDRTKVKNILQGIDRLCDGEGKVDADSYQYMIDSLKKIKKLNDKTTK